jgi:RNA polymerase-binding transcription factor DksA
MPSAAIDQFEDMKHCARRVLLGWRDQLCARTDAREDREQVCRAVERIERGTWGECVRCHGAIGRNRLLAMPETACCLSCTR